MFGGKKDGNNKQLSDNCVGQRRKNTQHAKSKVCWHDEIDLIEEIKSHPTD